MSVVVHVIYCLYRRSVALTIIVTSPSPPPPQRAGVIGFSLAVLAQSLSLASVFLPGTAFWPLADPASQSRVSVITLFCGIILARFGECGEVRRTGW